MHLSVPTSAYFSHRSIKCFEGFVKLFQSNYDIDPRVSHYVFNIIISTSILLSNQSNNFHSYNIDQMSNPVNTLHQPQRQKSKVYYKVNAYTQTPSCQQITALILFITQLALHSAFILPTLSYIRMDLLWILLGFHYSLLLVIIYDYIYLTIKDPVDQLIVHQQLINRYTAQEMKVCVECSAQVLKGSHHCKRCRRCTQNFDHHCKYLNNCIGSRNYESFFRLITIDSVYNINLIAQSLWVLIVNWQNNDISFDGNKWGVLACMVLSSIVCMMVGLLLLFHCYISCKETTTYKYLYPSEKSFSGNQEPIEINNDIPESAQRFGGRIKVIV